MPQMDMLLFVSAPELAPGVVCAPDGHVDTVVEVAVTAQVKILVQLF